MLAASFAEFSISSMHIKTEIAFFFVTAPYKPMQKRIAARIK
jgi:hypothetical protein